MVSDVSTPSACVRRTMSTSPRRSERLAAGEPHLPDAEPLHADRDQPHDLVVGQRLLGGQPVEALGRHAVVASQVAPVGQRDPQVRGHAAEAVRQGCRHDHKSTDGCRTTRRMLRTGRITSPGAQAAVPGLTPLDRLRARGRLPGVGRVAARRVAVPPAGRPAGTQRDHPAQREGRRRPGRRRPGPRPRCRRGRRVAHRRGHRDVRRRGHRGRPLPHPRRCLRRRRRRPPRARRRHEPAGRPWLVRHRQPWSDDRRRARTAGRGGRRHRLGTP